ncbi:MAG: hypothetical protein DRG36_00910 [Deltaproteobacteria bacterium]|nr:MAG: hypothetical protein DRG36_00910 [Deltaproteobacteria bacterium]
MAIGDEGGFVQFQADPVADKTRLMSPRAHEDLLVAEPSGHLPSLLEELLARDPWPGQGDHFLFYLPRCLPGVPEPLWQRTQ